MSFNLETLENRYRRIATAVESDAHTQVGEIVLQAAKDLLGLIPDGVVVEDLLTSLDRVSSAARALVDAAPLTPGTHVHDQSPVTPVVDGPAPVTVQGEPIEGLTTTETAASTASATSETPVAPVDATGEPIEGEVTTGAPAQT